MTTTGIVRASTTGIELHVRLTPKSAHDRVDGVELRGDQPFLKVRVRAVPEDGKANTALEKLIADWIGIARGQVKLTAGQTARIKTIAVTGDPDALRQTIEDLIANLPE